MFIHTNVGRVRIEPTTFDSERRGSANWATGLSKKEESEEKKTLSFQPLIHYSTHINMKPLFHFGIVWEWLGQPF